MKIFLTKESSARVPRAGEIQNGKNLGHLQPRFLKRIIWISLFLIAGITGLLTSIWTHQLPSLPFVEPTRTVHYPLTFVAHLKNDSHVGKKIFYAYCASCHGNNAIISVGAPRVRNKKEWVPFEKMGMAQLFALASQGYGAMPARGGCFECSDDQLKAAIDYLIGDP